jgi:hypothetical protein
MKFVKIVSGLIPQTGVTLFVISVMLVPNL